MKHKSYGIYTIDPREGQVEKSFIGQDLDRIHNQMRWNSIDISEQCPNIIERLLFSTSDKTIGIQLVDLYCYPIYHMFEYNKTVGEYWRFDKISALKLEAELKFYPEGTKKGLRFFA